MKVSTYLSWTTWRVCIRLAEFFVWTSETSYGCARWFEQAAARRLLSLHGDDEPSRARVTILDGKTAAAMRIPLTSERLDEETR